MFRRLDSAFKVAERSASLCHLESCMNSDGEVDVVDFHFFAVNNITALFLKAYVQQKVSEVLTRGLQLPASFGYQIIGYPKIGYPSDSSLSDPKSSEVSAEIFYSIRSESDNRVS